MVRIGIIGCGSHIGIAKNHIRAYLRCKDSQITACYDLIEGRAADYINQMDLKEAKACTSLDELFSLCDAVSICTPNATHSELTIAALKAGKHVLCEKPFAPTLEECDAAVRYAKLSNKAAMIGLCYRDIPGFVFMKQLIDEGRMGRIFFVREEQGGDRFANPAVQLEWRTQSDLSGPGALADFGSHMMDICDYLLRDSCGPVMEISCMQTTVIPEREKVFHPGTMGAVTNDDVACWICRTESGALYNFTASRVGASFLLEIVGEGGKIIFDGSKPFQLTLQLKDKNGPYQSAPEVVPVPENCYGGDENAPRVPFEINFYYEIRQFLDVIQTGRETKLSLERGRYIQSLIQTAQDSADMGQVLAAEYE